MPNKKRKPIAILTADMHIRSDTPICRTDNLVDVQFEKLRFIFELSNKLNVPILCAGDIGDKHQWKNWLLCRFIELVFDINLSNSIFAIPGQHDLPQHNLELWKKAGIGVLHEARVIDVLGVDGQNKISGDNFSIYPFPYGVDMRSFDLGESDKPCIAMTHQFVIESVAENKWQESYSKAKALLKKYPCYDVILSGDNHKPFVVEYEGRKLVNPGSMMRTTAAQIKHKPRVYILYDDMSVEAKFISIEDGVVVRDHIVEVDNERDERIDSYVKKLKEEYEMGFSYEDNMKIAIIEEKVGPDVEKIIWECIGGEA